jgi:tetratricopeptide (TPR) repeat protein
MGPDTRFLYGVDLTTGEPVAIEQRRGHLGWEEDLLLEAAARRVATVRSRSLAGVLHAGPGVVLAAPPPAMSPSALAGLPVEDVAELALEACEVAAALHAAGVAGLPFAHWNPRVALDRGRPFVHWMVPVQGMDAPLFPLYLARGSPPRAEPAEEREDIDFPVDPVKRDLWGLVHFFFALRPAQSSTLDAMRRFFGLGSEAARVEALDAMRRAPAQLPPDVASLAQTFAALGRSAGLAERAAALPVIASVSPIRLDLDAVIADGEAVLASGVSIGAPLAHAYHQRASRAWAAGEHDAALRDAERAVELDGDWRPYRTTCAVILDRLGRPREALRQLRAPAPAPATPRRRRRRPVLTKREKARFSATRGLVLLRLGKPAEAARDLLVAFEVSPTAFHAHALGAARYASGDMAGAAEAEARSVELDPGTARYRWALVLSLRRLGRDGEARRHAEEILSREPESAAHRERFARLFPGPSAERAASCPSSGSPSSPALDAPAAAAGDALEAWVGVDGDGLGDPLQEG